MPAVRMSRRAVLSAAGAGAATSALPALTGPAEASNVAPEHAQRILQRLADLRFGMFNHFSLGTFTGEEWARPHQSPTLFAPPQVDCEQWADAAVAAKMSYGVLTTKHHDGFCLWPSAYTGQTVANSGYRHDIVAQYVEAFRSRGLKVGLYFSIWDRTQGVEAYDTRHGVPASEVIEPGDISYVLGQIRELLTNYGKIDMFVMDGYAWQMGQQALPYQQVRNLVRSLQPDTVMIDHGGLSQPWLGDAIYFEQPLGITAPQGNSYVGLQGQTISNGWFWHPHTPTTEPLKRNAILDHLTDLEAKWTSLILNCPPNRAGRLDDNIVARLAEVGAAWKPQPRKALPAQPRRVEWPITPVAAYATAYYGTEGPMRAIDGKSNTNLETCWSTWRLPMPQAITVDLGGVWRHVSTLEYLPKQWSRNYLTDGDITSYTISTSVDGVTFTEVARGTWAPNMTTKVAEWAPRDVGYLRLEAHRGTDDYVNVSGLAIGGRRNRPTLVSRLPLTTGSYRIEARHSGKAATAGTADGTNIAQSSWQGTATQTWTFDSTGDGYFKIRSVASGKLMEVAGLSRVNGGTVVLRADQNLFQQHWAITPVAAGHYLLTNRLSGLSLNVSGASTADGAGIVQWLYGSGAHEQWGIVAV
ncbi:alpha-L-fucosidase [Micromonospora zingiberis]|uniref:alpha-L-fucosidase n=1 Tax=Micromonospora zingiberis TaxID=2053011 RepID=A0A4R0GQI4_9ACTN|nr:alpha-L-fucosidase [Micromonospora zingiberis]TCB97999.1 alpha-L-fucosidase [Micromonospora zingiberis]